MVKKGKKRSLMDFVGKWPGPPEELDRIEEILAKERKEVRSRDIKFD